MGQYAPWDPFFDYDAVELCLLHEGQRSKLQDEVEELKKALEAKLALVADMDRRLEAMVDERKTEQAMLDERKTEQVTLEEGEERDNHWRIISHGTEGHRCLDVYSVPVHVNQDGMLDGEHSDKECDKEGLMFGERVLVKETKVVGNATWLYIHGTSVEGWVVGESRGNIVNCVDMGKYRNRKGPIPAAAWLGQDFLNNGMYTEGYPGSSEVCVASASGDNFWRDLNVEMLFRDIATATIFEQHQDDADFTDWAAAFACNCAMYGRLGNKRPRNLKVTVKPTADYTAYPRKGPPLKDVNADLGRAQFRECEWLHKTFSKKGLKWEDVEFMTTFQFMRRFCGWSEEDCQKAATEKARRVLSSEAFATLDAASMDYQWKMVNGSLNEAFRVKEGGVLPGDMVDILTVSAITKDKVKIHLERFLDANEDVRNIAAEAFVQMGTAAVPTLVNCLQDDSMVMRGSAARVLGMVGGTAAICALQESLKDGAWEVRLIAAQALGKIGSAAAVPALQESLKDKSEYVRYYAVQAIGNIGGTEAVQALRERLADSDSMVQLGAAKALRQLRAHGLPAHVYGGA